MLYNVSSASLVLPGLGAEAVPDTAGIVARLVHPNPLDTAL